MAGKAPSFKQRVRVALEAARAARVPRLKITDRDGASFDFNFAAEQSTDDTNDFDVIINKRRKAKTQ
jgi:hypothetical protein